ncbi:MAG TPA: hypothetical protein VGD97_05090 [Lacunisphaera sp.]
MDSSAPRSISPSGWPRAGVWLLAAGFVVYAFFLARYSASYASGSDASGYFNSARLLAEGRFAAPLRVPAGRQHTEFGLMTFQPLGFIVAEDVARMAPTYPTGLPLHLLAAARIAGWRHAATVVNIFAALGTGLVFLALARRLGLSLGWAAVGLVLLWLSPQVLFTALQPMSDLLALLWSLTALYAALRSREAWRWSLFAGLAAALAVLVRPTNALLVLPLAIALGTDYRRHLGLALGGLPGAAFFFYYNWRAYGSPLTTGYGDVATAFRAGYAPHNLAHFARWIPTLLSPLVVAALAAPWVPAARRRELVVLGLWTALLIGFYAFYFHSGESWWYLRFILPAFPVLLLAALVTAQSLWSRLPSPLWSRAILAAVLVFAAAWQVRFNRTLEVLAIPANEATYLHAADWAKSHLPPEAAVCCMQVSGAFYYYTEFLLVRWDQVREARRTDLFASLQEERRPVYAVLYEYERADAFARLGGQWRQLATVGQATFWQLEPPPVTP